jgi:hypothetical protein
MRLAEHGGKGRSKISSPSSLLTWITQSRQSSAPGVRIIVRMIWAARSRASFRLATGGAVPIDQRAFGIGAVEIHLDHTRLL